MDKIRSAVQCEETPLTGRGVRVAVIDTGIDPEHPDFCDCYRSAESKVFCMSLRSDPIDLHGHGSHIAGIIAGNGASSNGRYRGIAPGVDLLVLKAVPSYTGLAADVTAAVLYAVEQGVDIINYSGGDIGGTAGPPPWKWPTALTTRDEAFRFAFASGILCVCAAGNEGPTEGTVVRPGILPEVLCVGSVSLPDNLVADGSARGPAYLDPALPAGRPARYDPLQDQNNPQLAKPDLVAPGDSSLRTEHSDPLLDSLSPGPVSVRSSHSALVGIDASNPLGPYTRISGTSQATAVVTGLAALLLEMGRERGVDWGDNTALALREILKESARPLTAGTSQDYGCGGLTLPQILETLHLFQTDDMLRSRLLYGRQLRLMD